MNVSNQGSMFVQPTPFLPHKKTQVHLPVGGILFPHS